MNLRTGDVPSGYLPQTTKVCSIVRDDRVPARGWKANEPGRRQVLKQIFPIVMATVLIGSAVGYAIRAMRRGATRLNASAAAFNLLASAVTSLLMVVHL